MSETMVVMMGHGQFLNWKEIMMHYKWRGLVPLFIIEKQLCKGIRIKDVTAYLLKPSAMMLESSML